VASQRPWRGSARKECGDPLKSFETMRLSGGGNTGMAGNDSDMMLFSFFGQNSAGLREIP